MRKLVVLLILVIIVIAVPVSAQRGNACTVSVANNHLLSPGTIRGFDPQPDPPAQLNFAPSSGLDKVGFNPQPDPPASPLRVNTQLCDGSV